ncbi:MAG: methylenetetrahydrofolate reductase [Lentisphaeria bacterium]|jgi:methylenetetrahydrofolate reductase (NADPH)
MPNSQDTRYRVEVSPPKHGAETLTARLERFAARYRQVIAAGHAVCITDNAMGHLCFQGHELIRELGLPVPPGQVMIHLNTFHTLADLHWILDGCAELGVTELLVVSGDGAARLPKLAPAEVGGAGASVTSVELLAYIRRHYGRQFRLGAAFNPYEPAEHELEKLRRKVAAGADFIITQPITRANPLVGQIKGELKIPVILEAWMSPKLSLLSDCIGYDLGDASAFDPLACLAELHRSYPGSGFYLALLDFKTQFDRLPAGGAA